MSERKDAKSDGRAKLVCLSGKASGSRKGGTRSKTENGTLDAPSINATRNSSRVLTFQDGALTEQAKRRLILPDESEEEWAQLLRSWQDEYQFENAVDKPLVVNAAKAEWNFRRWQRRCDDAEQKLFLLEADAFEWNDNNHVKLNRFNRYRAAAERSFYRARNTVEQVRHQQGGAHNGAPPASAQYSPLVAGTAKVQPISGPIPAPEPVAAKPAGAIIQCVTVQVLEGKAFTLFQPRNEYLARMIEGASDPRPVVKRAIYFLHGIPAEYEWVREYENHDGRPHLVIERNCDEALADLKREREDGSGHVLPIK